MDRPNLDNNLTSIDFKQYYYLKEELVNFCKKNNIPSNCSKEELNNRIIEFLDTGKCENVKQIKIKLIIPDIITLDTRIENNFVCSEKHRKFFKEQIGNTFSFNVEFQKWLKNNMNKTYKESIDAYYLILQNKKNHKTNIDKQFEYNTYIRDFFEQNKDKSLEQAIKCWKYKKSLKGTNKYDKTDLVALK